MSTRKNVFAVGFIFLNMLILGILQSVRGPILPFIQDDYGLSYSGIGLVITICSVGMLLGIVVGGRVCERLGYQKGVFLGILIMLVSLLTLGIEGSVSLLFVIFFTLYFGLGWVDIALNSLGSRLFLTKTAILMSLTHFFFGVGLSGGSGYAGMMLVDETSWRYIFLSIALLFAISLLLTFLTKFPVVNGANENQGMPFATAIRDSRIWLFLAVLGLATVFDLGIANWLVIYLRGQAMSASASASFLSLYFILFAVGRLVGGVVAEKVGYLRVFSGCVVASGLLFMLGIITGVNLLFAVTGLFTSVFFPLFLALIVQEFEGHAPAVLNIVLPLNSIIFMTSSLILGAMMERFGVRYGFYMIGLFMLVAPMFIWLLKKKLHLVKR